MGKQKKPLAKAGTVKVNKSETELGRGQIKSNFLAALVTSKVYKCRLLKRRKAKVHISVKLKI